MKYTVTGRVLPERAGAYFKQVAMQDDGGGTVTASCDASQLTIVLDDPKIDGWVRAKIVADDIGHIVVGALGFSLGCGYATEIVQVTEESGTPHVFGVRPEGESGQTLSNEPIPLVFERVTQLSGRDVFFRLAIRDYLRAINDVTDCATYCYRAIEGIKAAFVAKTGSDSWEDMHRELGTDRGAITSKIKQYADPIRHGNWIRAKSTTGAQRFEMLLETRAVLLKYLDHALPQT